MNAIVLDNLRKCYGDLWAVDGVSFEVRRGEIFGMVGPNGAGKTTTIECLEGLRRATEGRASVLGLDTPQNLIASLDAENRVVFAVDSPIDLIPFRAIPGVSRVAQAVGMIAAFPMMFLSGSAIPLEVLPQSVRNISRFIPLTHVVTLMRGLWTGASWGKHLTEAAVLAGVLLIGMLLSARFFRWE